MIDPHVEAVREKLHARSQGRYSGFIVTAEGYGKTSLEKVFEKESDGWCCFLEVIGLDNVTIEYIKEIGFSYSL